MNASELKSLLETLEADGKDLDKVFIHFYHPHIGSNEIMCYDIKESYQDTIITFEY